jgi:hypothetical protein
VTLISIDNAAAAGICRLRQPQWANPLDHIKLDLLVHPETKQWMGRGPWAHLWAPFNKECNGRDPVDVLIIPASASLKQMTIDPDEKAWVPYDGPDETSDEYKAACAQYEGALK